MEVLSLIWSFIVTVFSEAYMLLEASLIFVWELLAILHISYPRTEGLIIGITLAWFMSRRDRHPIIKTLSSPLKLIIDILDLAWDQLVELLSDVWSWHMSHWRRLGGWISSGYGWCKSKVVGCWSWCINGLKSARDSLRKKEEEE